MKLIPIIYFLAFSIIPSAFSDEIKESKKEIYFLDSREQQVINLMRGIEQDSQTCNQTICDRICFGLAAAIAEPPGFTWCQSYTATTALCGSIIGDITLPCP